MAEMSAVGEVQAEELITGIQTCHKYGHVGLRTGMGLHIGIFGSKKFLHAVYGHLFGTVHHLAATVIAMTGITFGIFVGKAGAHGLHYLFTHEIFRSNQLYAFMLTQVFLLDDVKDFGVAFHLCIFLYESDFYYLFFLFLLDRKAKPAKFLPECEISAMGVSHQSCTLHVEGTRFRVEIALISQHAEHFCDKHVM